MTSKTDFLAHRGKAPRAIVYNPEWIPEHSRRRIRVIENASQGLRIVGPVHEIARRESLGRDLRDNLGYYTDSYQDGVTVATVLQIPGADREPRYVPATSDPHNPDCYLAEFADATSDLADACRAADGLAEWYAEICREDEAKFQAEAQIDDARQAIADARATHSAIVRELRAVAIHPRPAALCAAIRERLAELRAEVHALRDRIRALRDNYWHAVDY